MPPLTGSSGSQHGVHMVQLNSSIRPKAAAEYLGVSPATLWRWAKERSVVPKARKLSTRGTVLDATELQYGRDAAPPVPRPEALH